jgi:hypothetical protein
VPLERILRRGNFFLRISSFPLFTPKNSIGFTVSRLMIVSVNTSVFKGIRVVAHLQKPAKGKAGLLSVF